VSEPAENRRVKSVLLVDPSTHGGIAVYTGLIAQALRTVDVQVSVLGSQALPAVQSPYDVRRWLPGLRWGKPADAGLGFYASRAAGWAASALVTEALALFGRPDVVHFQAPLNRRFDARLIRVLRRTAPVVWTAHDVVPFEGAEQDAARFAEIYRAADLVLVHGQGAADDLRRLAGTEPVVVEHVVAEPLVRASREEARSKLGLPPDGRMLAALGFVREYKGYDLLAETWELLGDEAPLLLVMGEVVAAGEDAVREPLERLQRSGRAVLRLAYASDADLQLAIAASDAVVLPYKVSSESGLLHQARALGVPVLASDAPQLAAAVEAGSAGRVLPREASAWAAAVKEPLPAPPAAPPSLADTGRAHAEAYEEAARRAERRRRG
jgi:glycosyltransferase involved in cell wall biosynthesis